MHFFLEHFNRSRIRRPLGYDTGGLYLGLESLVASIETQGISDLESPGVSPGVTLDLEDLDDLEDRSDLEFLSDLTPQGPDIELFYAFYGDLLSEPRSEPPPQLEPPLDSRATSGGECPVCLEALEKEVPALRCRHEFHAECLTKWRRVSSTCPTCRGPLL